MEISQKHVKDRELMLAEFKKYSIGKSHAINSSAFEGFLNAVIENFPIEDWLARPMDDLFGALLDFSKFVARREVGEFKVKVYTPSLDEDGWVCGRSVVLVSCDDLPFLVDSIRMVLDEGEYEIHVSKSTILECDREGDLLVGVAVADPDTDLYVKSGVSHARETFAYFEITTIHKPDDQARLTETIQAATRHVNNVVKDYGMMLERLNEYVASLEHLRGKDCEEITFLHWLKHSNFTFLGFRELNFEAPIDKNNFRRSNLREEESQRLGIFTSIDAEVLDIPVTSFAAGAVSFYEGNDLICFSKSRTRSTVHRNVYPDYIVLKKIDNDGNVVGELRFLGFYTYAVSSMSPREIPILRKKIDYVIQRSGLNPRSHDGKRLSRYIDLHPKEELFQASEKELFSCFEKIIALNERNIVRVVVRKDPFEQFISCMVFVPKDLYTTNLRIKIQELIGAEIGTEEADVTTFFSESKHARAHIVFRLRGDLPDNVDIEGLEKEVEALALGWTEHLKSTLDEKHGEGMGGALFKRFRNAFSSSYQERFDARTAVRDISIFQSLEDVDQISMQLYQPAGCAADEMRFRIAHLNNMLELSDVIPLLEALGLRVQGEQPFRIVDSDEKVYWIHDFQLKLAYEQPLDIRNLKQDFEVAFEKAWSKVSDNDSFNRLVVVAHLNWREINVLRAYANYMKQTLFNLSLEYIAKTLVTYPQTTKKLIDLFSTMFDPELKFDLEKRDKKAKEISKSIEDDLDHVQVLNQEKVFRRYLDLFHGTLRVNYYQNDESGQAKPYLSIKFNPANIADIPEPKPAYEFYVYSARVEGVHLRTSKVARGGLRWSDRREDYRTEVLGLVKAQQVKNAVIVPSGAKGGFVAKQLPSAKSRAKFFAEGVECYKIFIRGLLDLTDNIVEGEIVKPARVVCLDGDDPYLVVAADKGTATFSDIANEISKEKTHWLGDAFASGGSQGYDHKGMGITAKGAWVSVQRHFRELDTNTQKDEFTVVGIGDMAGDVFGNGMLLSKTIRLVAAFNHMHIFIDPSPSASESFKERNRLFTTSGVTWADYDKNLISKGGGVFSRSDKFISLTPEIKALIGTNATRLTPNELIHMLLKSEVDLIWNGGIGTYVKASSESHAEVGDKANDVLRVNGEELKCRVFGEGGNLGLTQLGRIEYAKHGGCCNTDFIDNAAGVDCSDHEVNIKILVDAQVENGDLTEKQRNRLLESMTDIVSDLVLKNNYRQTLALSVAEHQVQSRMSEYRRFISYLETESGLNRTLEFLPLDQELVERTGNGVPLTRPELSVLISYAKVQLKELLANSTIADDLYCARCLFDVFPEVLQNKYGTSIKSHKLRREIVATQLANDFINHLGITALHRLSETTSSSAEEVVKAYVVSRDVFGLEQFVQDISAKDYEIPSSDQHRLIANMIRRVRRGTRWFIKNRRAGLDAEKEVAFFRANLGKVQAMIGELLEDQHKTEWEEEIENIRALGINKKWQQVLAAPRNLFSGLSVIEITHQTSKSVEESAEMFFSLMGKLRLDWFATQLSDIKVENYWQASAREAYIDDLEFQLRKLSIVLLRDDHETKVDKKISDWLEHNRSMISRWTAMVARVEGTARTDYAMFAVALRELNDLVQITVHR